MAVDGATPQARAQAAWTLELLGKMTPAICQRLLIDPIARVREQGLLIAEKHPSDALIDAAAKLVNDDDAKVRLLLRRCFEGEGYRVTEAGSGADALERLARELLMQQRSERRWRIFFRLAWLALALALAWGLRRLWRQREARTARGPAFDAPSRSTAATSDRGPAP